jgi:putative membrane protein
MQRTEARPQTSTQAEGQVDAPAIAPQVDLRILQANERTLLAWVRMSLALMAFGFVVARISPWLGEAEASWSVWTGAAFLVMGTACNVVAAVRYVRIRSAVLEGRPVIPGRAAALSLAFGLALLGGLLAAHVVLR